jgi:2-amino-4-hydroxy-6-hydroxymethyldihydropteridine diphosphokinase
VQSGSPARLGLRLSASTSPERSFRAFLSLGSNIDPLTNLPQAVRLLRQHSPDLHLSQVYETRAVGSDGPNFLNLAAGLTTPLEAGVLKKKVLRAIEQSLGRVRTADKFAPRTIDLDIIVFHEQVLEPEVWRRVYLALPLSELLPGLVQPETGRSLREVAQQLVKLEPILLHPEVTFR